MLAERPGVVLRKPVDRPVLGELLVLLAWQEEPRAVLRGSLASTASLSHFLENTRTSLYGNAVRIVRQERTHVKFAQLLLSPSRQEF